MSDFKAKMYQIICRLGLCPDPAGGAYSAPQTPLLDFRGLLLRGRGREGGEHREGEEKGRKGKGRVGAGSAPQVKACPPPITIFLAPALRWLGF